MPPHDSPAGPPAPDDAAAAPVAHVLGLPMALHDPARDKYVSPVMARFGVYEPVLTELVLNEVRPGDVALDLGAHIGYYTLLLARLVGTGGRVVALEPDPDNYALLRRNVQANGFAQVTLFPGAAGDRPGRCGLHRSTDNAGDHRLHPADEARAVVDVDVVRVDWLFRDRAHGVDFVKMDVQGSEGAALEGMTGLLERSPRVKLLLEFWPLGLERSGYGAARLLDRLQALGFRVYEVDEVQGALRKADPHQLLARYPATEPAGFVNLWCVKAPLPAR
ncbi:Methyltransferase, FkbM family OS=Singulisphaera acidiphila (strain ATCC BAA-1392 / DSM 18658 / VKM B-2454 / MOB10) GN=Sinac_2265 PE=4 SV=1: Methyltransf_21 [Gemmata massiliana]|uniref:Methyltransferase FkbM domain-containing protein n=1 Tax=Gemmata massiliana TaxID=1210884 RepID=A0A6P2CRF7_9BACT|nr:FkbM family methyltransferase [Gemmata massiliana]VTR91658.1 Methyltransferase, FkbM family OS=Singulisphaera acidiphila (strain ATCC BAA-1392 / DSM 18658 / VKM B-2454 / MOB10) GN=Sinac_2265 PE=4 SV=1: Methyltransf_21 [Gemmata massiliana]